MGTGSDHRQDMIEREWVEVVEQGLKLGEIELSDKAIGISKQMKHEGLDSLSEKQEQVFWGELRPQLPEQCLAGHEVAHPEEIVPFWANGCALCNKNMA